MQAKVKRVMLWPSRTLDLGPGNGYAKLSAGLELEFDEPVELDDLEVQKTIQRARDFISNEFKAQYQPYKQFFKKPNDQK